MRILVSQNLYGVLESDGSRWTRLAPHGVLSNGLCVEGAATYLGDWSDVLVLDRRGEEVGRVGTPAQNCHTVRRHDGRLLIASTSTSEVVWGDETVFEPRRFGIRPEAPHAYYVNSAVPWRDDTILVGLRSHRAVVFFDLAKRDIERVVVLPFLRNLHHPTGFGAELFLVSDDDSVVMFDLEGRPLLRSPRLRWPRGTCVVSRSKVWVADRESLNLWNPQSNQIERRIVSPLPGPSSLPERQGDLAGGALFDVVVLPDDDAG